MILAQSRKGEKEKRNSKLPISSVFLSGLAALRENCFSSA